MGSCGLFYIINFGWTNDMLHFFEKRLSAKMLVVLVGIMVVSFAVLGYSILDKQGGLLGEMGENVHAQLKQTGEKIQNQLTSLEKNVGEQMTGMGTATAESLTKVTTQSLSAEGEKVRGGMEKLLVSSAEVVTAVLAEVAQEGIMAKNYDQLVDYSRLVSQTKDIVFLFFLDQDKKLLPSYVNIIDDQVLGYLEKSGAEDLEVEEQAAAVLEAGKNDQGVMIYERVVEYYNLPIGTIVVGVSKNSVVNEIAALDARFESLKQSNEESVRMIIGGESEKLLGLMKKDLATVVEQNQGAMDETARILAESALKVKSGTSWVVMLVGLICCVGVIIAAALMLRLMVIRPILNITNELRDTAEGEGDLTRRLNLKRVDEIGMLAKWFDTFVAKLNDIIVDIGSNSETVTTSSFEVLSASEQMQDESDDLKSKATAVNKASEEMNMSMSSVAAASEQASTNIGFVAEAAASMREALDDVVAECDRAQGVSHSATGQVRTATDKVSQLGEAAREISNVSEVITEIADQTNLLALNATIEAARAGDAGKGFAVVAGEIKDLAHQTQQATQQIKGRIEGIQQSTDDTVHEVGLIAKVIEDVDSIMSSIATSMTEQSQQASEVAQNIEQASHGISEVNENVAQSSNVSSHIAAEIQEVAGVANDMSEHSASMRQSAEGLSDLSSQLKTMISVFKVSVKNTQGGQVVADDRNIRELFPWNSRLETGLPKIDEQHKELVRLINDLHKAMKQKKGTAESGRILDELVKYTEYHFGFEEELFDRYNYPETGAHKKIHVDLVAKVNAFRDDFKSGRAGLSMDLMGFLSDWLRNHIMKTDKEYVSFFKDKQM